jgi:hypothetical protein
MCTNRHVVKRKNTHGNTYRDVCVSPVYTCVGEKLICYSAIHLYMHLNVQPKKLACTYGDMYACMCVDEARRS